MTCLQISTDKGQLDMPLIYQFLGEQSTWAVGMPRTRIYRDCGASRWPPATLMERYCPDVYRSELLRGVT